MGAERRSSVVSGGGCGGSRSASEVRSRRRPRVATRGTAPGRRRGVLEHVVDREHATRRDVRRPVFVVGHRDVFGVTAVDEQERRAAYATRAPPAPNGRRPRPRRPRAARPRWCAGRTAACPCGRSPGRRPRDRGAPSPAWFSSDPRWWSTVNSTVPRVAAPRRPGTRPTCRSRCRPRAAGRRGRTGRAPPRTTHRPRPPA